MGFSIGYQSQPRCVCVRTWGTWDSATAVAFSRIIVEECRVVVKPFNFLMDVTRLRPPTVEGQAAFRTIMVSLKMMGILTAVIVVGENAITKMQLMRIAKQNLVENWVYFPTEPPALERLESVSP